MPPNYDVFIHEWYLLGANQRILILNQIQLGFIVEISTYYFIPRSQIPLRYTISTSDHYLVYYSHLRYQVEEIILTTGEVGYYSI